MERVTFWADSAIGEPIRVGLSTSERSQEATFAADNHPDGPGDRAIAWLVEHGCRRGRASGVVVLAVTEQRRVEEEQTNPPGARTDERPV